MFDMDIQVYLRPKSMFDVDVVFNMCFMRMPVYHVYQSIMYLYIQFIYESYEHYRQQKELQLKENDKLYKIVNLDVDIVLLDNLPLWISAANGKCHDCIECVLHDQCNEFHKCCCSI